MRLLVSDVVQDDTAFMTSMLYTITSIIPAREACLLLLDNPSRNISIYEFGRGSFDFYKNGPEMAPQYKRGEAASEKSCQVQYVVYYKKTKTPGAPKLLTKPFGNMHIA